MKSIIHFPKLLLLTPLAFIFFLFPNAVSGQAPSANFSADITVGCPNMTVTFTDSSTSGDPIAVWAWDFGDGATSSLQNPTHTYAATGAYHVSLTITDMAGISDMMVEYNLIKVNRAPTASFALSGTSGCVPYNLHVNNTSTPGNVAIRDYLWDFGNGTTSTVQAPSGIVYPTTGPFTLNLMVVDSNDCVSTASTNLTVHPLPIADFSVNTTVECARVPLQFTDLSTGSAPIVSHNWNYGNGMTSGFPNPSFTYPSAGTFDVTLNAIDANGCVGTKTRTQYMTIKSSPDADFVVDKTTGQFRLTSFFTDMSTADTAITSYSWNFGDGSTWALDTARHNFRRPGKFTVSLTVTNAVGCSDTDMRNELIWVSVPFMPMDRINSVADVMLSQSKDMQRIAAPGDLTLSDDIQVFPNPVSEGPVYIQFPESIEGAVEINLYDLSGRVIMASQENVTPGTRISWTIPDQLPKGTYQLSIISGEMTYRKTLLKSR